jgi:hypothetical protein
MFISLFFCLCTFHCFCASSSLFICPFFVWLSECLYASGLLPLPVCWFSPCFIISLLLSVCLPFCPSDALLLDRFPQVRDMFSRRLLENFSPAQRRCETFRCLPYVSGMLITASHRFSVFFMFLWFKLQIKHGRGRQPRTSALHCKSS